MRVLFSCAELGLGHAARTIALGKKLEKNGHDIFFFSGGKAYELLKKEFKRVSQVTPVAWYENAHGIIASASLLNILFPLPIFDPETNRFEIKNSSAMETIHRYYDLRRNIKATNPELLISDGDIHALRLSDRWKIPSVYITNLIRPSYGFSTLLNPGERITERYVKHCRKIIIPDNPPPYTISEYNVGDLNQIGIKQKTEFVGSFFNTTPTQGKEEEIFAPVSGPPGTRAKLTQTILPLLKTLNMKSTISLGVPGKKLTATAGNCTIHAWLTKQEREEHMKNSKFIIFSGGHITCFETIKHTKPSICIPTQPEQMGNAAKLQDLGCSVTAKNKQQLRTAVQKIVENMQFYQENMRKINKFSNKYNGLERAEQIIEDATN
jgi:UDP-N-acetylglucosamine--N-acetylmuramyl-(pentapeptide) pyrophosphoryl-undecaprenol N-acetylglucosamine transferase